MLELKNISYIVNEDGKEKAILKDINLEIKKGEHTYHTVLV